MQTQRNINKYINKSIVTTHKPISTTIYGYDQTGTTGLCNPSNGHELQCGKAGHSMGAIQPIYTVYGAQP